MTASRGNRHHRRLAVALGGLGLPAVAAAQQAAPHEIPAAGPDIVVTGERVRGSAIGDVAPVAILDPAAIKALGATSLADLLKRVKGMTTSASGGDPVFLLNGRRISGFGEMQSLPPEAMERIEVLPEQEASRFGFPPTVRVMNFITKKRFRSLALQELVGTTTEGGGASSFAEAISTRIDGDRRTSLSVSHLRQNPILQSQRRIVPDPDALFAIGGTVTGIGGASIDPALDALAGRAVTVAAVPADPAARGSLAAYAATANVPGVTDIGRYRSLVQRSDTIKVDGTIAAPIGGAITGSLNLTMEAQRNAGLSGLAPAVLTVPAGGVLPFADAVLLNRYLPDSVLHQHATNLNLHAGGTVQGSVRRWTWNVTGTYDRVRSSAFSEREVPLSGLQAAIDAGGDPLAPIDPATAALRTSDRSRTVTGTLETKAVVNGPLLHLPAGDALLTVSTNYARSTSRGSQPGVAQSALMLGRTTMGASVNADLPIASADLDVLPFLGRLAANGTIGVASVSNYGRLTSSTYGLTWAPVRGIQFAASVNASQTPPPIALLSAPTLIVPNTPFFDFTTGMSVLVTAVSGGNPALTPEQRRVTTIGVAVTPIRGKEFRVNFDYLDTRITDQTGTLGSATAAFQTAFPDQFVRNALGQLIRVDLRQVNLAAEQERKLRLAVTLMTQLGREPPAPAAPTGATPATAPPPPPPRPRAFVFANVTGTVRLEDRLMLGAGLAPLDLLDGATLNGTGGRPRWEIEGGLSASYGPANLGVYGQLQGPTRIRSTLATSDLSFSGRTLLVFYSFLDIEPLVRATWTRRMSLQLTVENLLNDRIDVRDRNGATPNRFQSAYLDPLGRSIRFGIRKLF